MQVAKIIDGNISYIDIPRPTDEEMQNEYDYILAEEITRKLLDMGIISPPDMRYQVLLFVGAAEIFFAG